MPNPKATFTINAKDATKVAFRSVRKGLNSVAKSVFSLKGALVGLAGGFSLGLVVSQLVDVNQEFGNLRASLETVTGSQQRANQAFTFVEKFASTTPFQLQEVTGAFVKLNALGLNPSAAALRAYGNTAAAMGKSLDQAVEAVADAATGEFERLKEFGIKASSQGNQVAFTFRGVTTTVKKNAADIEAYLQGIGEVQFAGAMERQMNTIGGAVSNAKDAMSAAARAIGDAGLRKAVIGFMRGIGDIANGLTASMKGVQIDIGDVRTLMVESLDDVGKSAGFVANAFQGLKVVFKGLEVVGRAVVAALLTSLDELQQAMARIVQPQLKLINYLTDANLSATFEGLSNAANASREALIRTEDELAAIAAQPMPSDAVENWFNTVQEHARAAAQEVANVSDFELDFSNAGNTAGASEESPEDIAYREKLSKRFKALNESLLSEQDRLRLHHEENAALVQEAFELDLVSDAERKATLESLEEEHLRRLEEIQRGHMSREVALWRSGWQGKAAVVSGVLGQVSNLMQSQSKRQFEIGKKAAIANTLVETYLGAQRAFTALVGLGPFGPVLAAAAAAAATLVGLNRVRAIKSQQFSGGGAASGTVGSFPASPNTGLPVPANDSFANTSLPQTANAQQGGGVLQITVNGALTPQVIDDYLIPALRDRVSNGDQILIERNSRNALDLAG